MCTIIYPQKYPYSSNFSVLSFSHLILKAGKFHIFFLVVDPAPDAVHTRRRWSPRKKGFVLPSFSHCEPGECLLVNYKEKRFKRTLPEKYNFFYQMKFNTKFFIKFILARRIPSSYSLCSALLYNFISRTISWVYSFLREILWESWFTNFLLLFFSGSEINENLRDVRQLLPFTSPGSWLSLLANSFCQIFLKLELWLSQQNANLVLKTPVIANFLFFNEVINNQASLIWFCRKFIHNFPSVYFHF